MRYLIFAGALMCAATSATAQDWSLRGSDQQFAAQDLTTRLSGQTLTFYDDGQSEYYADGRYTYTYANDGGVAYGYYRIEENSTVCVDYVNGFARCDMFVQAGDQLVLLTEKGERFPIRP